MTKGGSKQYGECSDCGSPDGFKHGYMLRFLCQDCIDLLNRNRLKDKVRAGEIIRLDENFISDIVDEEEYVDAESIKELSVESWCANSDYRDEEYHFD